MSTHSAAEKAARKLRSWVANRTTVHRAAPQLSERHLTDVIQGAIDAATAAQQARIEKLEAALRRARCFIEYARYELEPGIAKDGAQFPGQGDADVVMAEIDALAPVERGGDANAAR